MPLSAHPLGGAITREQETRANNKQTTEIEFESSYILDSLAQPNFAGRFVERVELLWGLAPWASAANPSQDGLKGLAVCVRVYVCVPG